MPRSSLRPVAVAFIVFGFFAGAWAVATYDIKRTFGLSDTKLGLLLAAGIGAATLVAAVGGAVADRFGAGQALAGSLAAWSCLLALEAAAPHFGYFACALTLGTAAGGLVDVVMNVVAANALASEPGQLVRFHGLFNGGAVLGAAATGLALRFGASWRAVWIAMVLTGLASAVMCHRADVPELAPTAQPSMLRALTALGREGLLVVAAVFGAAAMVEGGVATWGILYLRDNLGLGVLAGVTAYVIGESLATAARIGGGGFIGRLGSRRSIAIGAGLAAAGVVTEAVCTIPAIAAIGLGFAAVGISVVWPLLIADVSNQAAHPAMAIGGVTASGYLGMVAGPPIVGLLAGAFGLRLGLLALGAAGAFVAVTPARIRRPAPLAAGTDSP